MLEKLILHQAYTIIVYEALPPLGIEHQQKDSQLLKSLNPTIGLSACFDQTHPKQTNECLVLVCEMNELRLNKTK